MSGQDAHSAPATCENCATPLQGHYCHACGQSVHSPTRHFGHALEEVFESFWHLDGRVFRTLRELMVPGRVARNYLAGQRVRYIAPLRLFVILSLLTFFIGKLAIRIDETGFVLEGREAEIAQAQTIPEVESKKAALLKEVSALEKEAAKTPGPNASLLTARARIQSEAAERIAELREQAKAEAAGVTSTDAAAAALETVKVPAAKLDDKEWDPKTNPVDVAWLPAFADRWINQRLERAKNNISHLRGNTNRYLQAFLGAIPTTLFLLMPVFALLLKVLYLGTGRRYLEHLVVALYSHAWLLLVLLATFLTTFAAGAIGTMWATIANALVINTLWLLCVPVYLFIMQLRVYREHWALTAARYLVVGTVYFFLVVTATLFAAFAGISA